MTKAQKILALYSAYSGTMPENKLPKHIATEVGTTDAYVRTVARQRKGHGASESEIRYLRSPLGRQKIKRGERRRWQRIRADPIKHSKYLARLSAWRLKRRAEAHP